MYFEPFGSAAVSAQTIFGQRASFYTTSTSHTDPQVLQRVVEMASPRPDWLALDIATGTGHTAFALAAHAGHVVGVDFTAAMLNEAAGLRTTQAIRNVTFCLADVHGLPFADAAFHLVACRRAAHHFSRIGHALQEMRRMLRPGGRMVIDDRSVPEDDFVDQCMNALDVYHDHSHVRQYRPSAWITMLETQGFAVEEVEPYTRHRPLTSLTGNIPREDAAQIHRILEPLTEAQRAALNLVERGGELYLNHWFVMISARKI